MGPVDVTGPQESRERLLSAAVLVFLASLLSSAADAALVSPVTHFEQAAYPSGSESTANSSAREVDAGADPAVPVLAVWDSLTLNRGGVAAPPGHGGAGHLAAEQESGEPRLTASMCKVPLRHDGSSAFTVLLAFSENVDTSIETLRDHSLTVIGGRATGVKPVDGRRDLWAVTVEPFDAADVILELAATGACNDAGAVCTRDGRKLSVGLVALVSRPATLSVAGAEAYEGPDEVLEFVVSLSRAAFETVTVAYATLDGTAQAGADYAAAWGTLTFAPGEWSKTVEVMVLDDPYLEGEETMRLYLRDASGAIIGAGEATGTIGSSDYLPTTWLARSCILD